MEQFVVTSLNKRHQKFVEVIVSSSTTDNFEEAILEWNIIGIIENDNSVEEKKEEKLCICGHKNTLYYKIINRKNKNILHVAFDCLSKLCPTLKDTAVVMCKQHNYQKTSKVNDKRMCHGCLKHTIDKKEGSWKNICGNCWGSGTKTADYIPMLGYRMCNICCVLNISPTEDSFKDKCMNCFKQSVDCSKLQGSFKLTKVDTGDNNTSDNNSGDMRQCIVCEKVNIKASEPEFKNKCVTCYKLTKDEKPMRQCSVCNKHNIDMSEPEFKNKCRYCYRTTKDDTPMRACSVCNKMNIKATEPAFKNKCYACFSATPKTTTNNNDAMENYNMLRSLVSNNSNNKSFF